MYICPRASNCVLKLIKHFEKIFKDISVYFPANICYTLPLSVSYSEAKIELYDIDFNTLYPDFIKICQKIREGILRFSENSLIIFVVVVPYGNWSIEEMNTTKEKARKILGSNLFILWDCALCFPTKERINYILNNLTEDQGFLFSFSYAKPIELGFGSVLFTKQKINHSFENTIDKNTSSFLVNRVDKIFKTYLNFDKIKNKRQTYICYNSELEKEDSKYIYQMLENILKQEDFYIQLRKNQNTSYYEILNKKIENNSFFRRNLEIQGIQILDNDNLSWRFNIRVYREMRDKIIEKIFRRGGFVSRLFPNISGILGKPKREYENTSKNWQTIINIFNNQQYHYNQIIIDSIQEAFYCELK